MMYVLIRWQNNTIKCIFVFINIIQEYYVLVLNPIPFERKKHCVEVKNNISTLKVINIGKNFIVYTDIRLICCSGLHMRITNIICVLKVQKSVFNIA